jgi:lysophospholipase L1-like esterase
LLALSICASLALGEGVIRLVVNPGDFLLATVVSDPVLGQRIEPHTTGHDGLGFRNASTPERADIVAIGDSQTYGVGAARDASWPSQLAGLLSEPVYNMALGGYGPLEYVHLAKREARKLRPRTLLVGFYFGNDLVEACRAAQERPYWRDWQQAGSAVVSCDIEDDQPGAESEPGRLFGGLRDWLSRHSVLYALVRSAVLAPLAARGKNEAAPEVPADRQMPWTDPSAVAVQSIFTPQRRLSVLDPRQPRVQQGLRITKRAFAAIKSEADEGGRRLLVVLIPTKERAYCRYLQDTRAQLPAAFSELCRAEDQIKAELLDFFTAASIEHVDATAAMEERIRQHIRIYPQDADGHPQRAGYGAIARAVHEALRPKAP